MAGQIKVEDMSCGGKCLKFFLGMINIIFFIVGLVLAGFGKLLL